MKRVILLIVFLIPVIMLKAQTFFSEDFASGIPAGWTNVDNSGNNVLWRTTTTGSMNPGIAVDSTLNPVGTSAVNGYLIIDSDSAGQLLTEDAVLTTAGINCNGHSSVHLSFNEYFAQYLVSTGDVYVSNDNVSWTLVHSAHTGLGLNQGTPNPNSVDVDITALAANQSSVYVRFAYHGEWDYWWFVDDVQLFEPPAIDLAATSIEKLNDEYTLIPLSQATALTLSAQVTNNGSAATTGGTALYEVVNAGSAISVFSENINLPGIAAGTSQIIVPSAGFIPSSPGGYYSRLTISIAGDANSANDILASDTVLISDTTYARDDNSFAGTQGIGVGPGEDAITGQNFRVNSTDDLTSITFFMGDNFGAAVNGTPVYFTVHPQLDSLTQPDESTVSAVSDTILFTPGMIPVGGAYYTVQVQGGSAQLTPGLYYVGIHETDSILTIGYSNAIYSPGAVWVHWNSFGWARAEDLTVQIAYMIRANFGTAPNGIVETPTTDVLRIFPNPSKGKIFLRFPGKPAGETFSIKIFNALGQQKYSGEWKREEETSIDLSCISGGVYNVVVSSSQFFISKKIILTE